MDLTNNVIVDNALTSVIDLETLKSLQHLLAQDPLIDPTLLNPYYGYQVLSS